jgi:hypothetical protein
MWLGLDTAAEVCDIDLLLQTWDQELLQEDGQAAP